MFVQRGLDINFIKTPLIYRVSYFNLGGSELRFGRLSPPKPPHTIGLGVSQGRSQGGEKPTKVTFSP